MKRKKNIRKNKIKQSHPVENLILLLLLLVVLLVVFFSLSVKDNEEEQEVEEYQIEEVIEAADVIPEETEESPKIEKVEEEVQEKTEILNEVTVLIKNLRFDPKDVTISPGTTVTWINNDTVAHKVVAYDRLFYGPRLNSGDKYSFTFMQEGTHRYFDAVFPKIGRGKIVVKEEPLPITGSVIAVGSDRGLGKDRFALLVLLFVVMISALSHGIYNHYSI